MFDPSPFVNPTPLAHADTSRGSRNSDNVERRGWNQRRMSNIGNNRGNWRNSEVVLRPNNGRNDYRGNYENSRQVNQWFESRNRFLKRWSKI
ncbi:uncharacterized protein TNCV_4307251 [Trichonephila clavipes]|nr:uncharacterized protein TNCV_4307251 [Trichonephila clavipes]